MSFYGQVEASYFQLTSQGLSRIQSGNLPQNLDIATRKVLNDMAEFGGTAEWDELKMVSGANPQVLGVSIKRLIDLGYIVPVGVESEEKAS